METQTWVRTPEPNPRQPLPGQVDCLCKDGAQGRHLGTTASVSEKCTEEHNVVSKSILESHSPPGKEGKDSIGSLPALAMQTPR